MREQVLRNRNLCNLRRFV